MGWRDADVDDDDDCGGGVGWSLWKVMGFEKKGFVGNERRGGVFRKRERGILVVTNRKEDEVIEFVAIVEDLKLLLPESMCVWEEKREDPFVRSFLGFFIFSWIRYHGVSSSIRSKIYLTRSESLVQKHFKYMMRIKQTQIFLIYR